MRQLTLQDDECLMYLQQKNALAMEHLIRIYFPVLSAYSFKITADKLQSQDIAEEALIKVWERHNAFETFNELKGFLYTTVKNMSLNVLRSKEREKNRVSNLEKSWQYHSEGEELIYEEMLAEIRKSIQQLSPKVRQIFILAYYKQMSSRQIAETLNLSEQTVRNQKSKALITLRKMLSDKAFSFLVLSLYIPSFPN